MKNRTLCILIPFLFISLFSCTSHKTEKKFRIGFSQCASDVWRQNMQKEMERELSFHPEVELIVKNAHLSSEKQVAQIAELLKEKIDLLIVSPNEAAPLTLAVDKVYKQGLPVIVVDRNILSKNYTAFIGASNYKVGLTAGAYVSALLKGKGNIIEANGLLQGSSADIGRHNGFLDFIKTQAGLSVKAKCIVDNEKDTLVDQLTPYLKNNPGIDLIFCHDDRVAFTAAKLCDKLGLAKTIDIIGIDGLPGENNGIDLVEKGALKATILYPSGGKEAIETAIKILEKKPYNKETDLATTIIDSTNVRIMHMQNEKVLAQQEDIDKRGKKIEEQIIITRNLSNIILAISLTLGLALICGGILFYYLQENKKINKKLENQKEEISNQRNQLIELGKKAKEATDAKINFFTNISHELRTPLTLVLGPVEDVIASGKVNFAVKAQLEMVKKNVMRLLRLVNQLMDFRKIEESKMKLSASENNLVEFVQDITNAFTETATKKNISFRVDLKEHEIKLWYDVNMLDKVLFNLLSNAFKYTPQHGAITVALDLDSTKSNAIVTIADSGIGMTPETQAHAFDHFYQGNEGTFKGTGLGLALSKELITLHHGTIKMESEKGKGTTFKISLPMGASHLEENEIAKETNAYELNYEDAKIYTDELQTVAAGSNINIAGGASDHSVLLIEDNDEIRIFLKDHLSKFYEIVEANNGNTGLNLAYEMVPDIIIADIMLPGKDGMAITEALKNDIRTSHIPIIILTAKGSMEQQIEGLKLKADAYMVKPFNLKHLEETIKSVIKNRELLREHYTSELSHENLRASAPKKIDRKFISEFTSIVESNIANENFGVDDICKEIGISRVQLYRKVKAVLGYNVNDYIQTVRLQKAKLLLANKDLTISEIAFKVGFASQAYFSTVFRSKFSMTPSEYKESKPKL